MGITPQPSPSEGRARSACITCLDGRRGVQVFLIKTLNLVIHLSKSIRLPARALRHSPLPVRRTRMSQPSRGWTDPVSAYLNPLQQLDLRRYLSVVPYCGSQMISAGHRLSSGFFLRRPRSAWWRSRLRVAESIVRQRPVKASKIFGRGQLGSKAIATRFGARREYSGASVRRNRLVGEIRSPVAIRKLPMFGVWGHRLRTAAGSGRRSRRTGGCHQRRISAWRSARCRTRTPSRCTPRGRSRMP